MLTFKSPNLVLKYAPRPNKIKVDCIGWWIWLKLNRKIYTFFYEYHKRLVVCRVQINAIDVVICVPNFKISQLIIVYY